jgi:uncharacterized Zn finger protein
MTDARNGKPRSRGSATNWWTRQWLDALESFGWEGRLQRGRTYARTGRVQSIDIKPGRVTARVQGSSPRPYRVTLALPTLSDQAWEKVADALASQARYAAALLAGEMPPTIEDAFASVGAHLFPHPQEPFETDCSCPDWANPCKHIAAVHYVLGTEFDRDPFLLFRLRGRSRDQVIAALRARRARSDETAPSTPGETTLAPSPPQPPLEADLEQFWNLGEDFSQLRFNLEPPRVPESLLKRLGSPTGPLDPDGALNRLALLYRTIAQRAIRIAYEDNGT